MKINVLAQVRCADGPAGFCSHIIVNSHELRVTHLVIQANLDSETKKLAPLGSISRTDGDGIKLDCTRNELSLLDDFVKETRMPVEVPDYRDSATALLVGDQIPTNTVMAVLTEQNISPDELALDSTIRVEATDGLVGLMDGLEVEPESGRITWLVMRKGHPESQINIAIPAAEIDYLESKAAFLKLDKYGIAALPVVPVGK